MLSGMEALADVLGHKIFINYQYQSKEKIIRGLEWLVIVDS